MDFLRGVPLSRAREEMLKRGIDPDSPESKLFARKLLTSLTQVFGRCILETGFFHADPHPGTCIQLSPSTPTDVEPTHTHQQPPHATLVESLRDKWTTHNAPCLSFLARRVLVNFIYLFTGNIFVLEDGEVGLIDFGQVKQISGRNRETLCKIMIALDERQSDDNPDDLALIGKLALELGVELNENAQKEAAAAVGMWLFDGTVQSLPGGYDRGELSPNSPVKELKSFPQDLVLVGRSSILIKGLSDRLGVPWSLASQWAPIARTVLAANAAVAEDTHESWNRTDRGRVRFRQVWDTFGQWSKGRAMKVAQKLPSPVRSKLAAMVVQREENRVRRQQEQKQQASSAQLTDEIQ